MTTTDPWADLPPYLHDPPKRDEWTRPTAWLLGTQIFGVLKKLALKAMHRGFDLRDWMHGEVRTFEAEGDGEAYWIDFVADSGDAPKLVYHLAGLLQRSHVEIGGATLPRGSILIVGGDTAYPVADLRSIEERFRAPFYWARRELGAAADPAVVSLFGLPGNHDYYDMIDGFNRQFREPCEPVALPDHPSDRPLVPYLALAGYARRQAASYFALELPFGWQLWGLDVEEGIDTRQARFFVDRGAPDKLIVATSRPLVVDRKEIDRDANVREALAAIGAYAVGVEPPRDRLRLDLAGDVHLYQRYYGPPSAAAVGAEPGAPARDRYATVVSGLGGAFHHPSQLAPATPSERIAPQAAWPTPARSAQEIGQRLIRWASVFRAGSVWIVGGCLALAFLFLSTPAPNILHVPQRLVHGEPAAPLVSDFLRAATYAIAWLAWGGLVVAAIVWGRRVRTAMRGKPDWFLRLVARPWILRVMNAVGFNRRVLRFGLTVAPLWLVVAGGAIALVWYAPDYPWFHLDDGRGIANIATLIVLAGFTGFGVHGGSKLWPARRPLMWLSGFVHGVLQVWTPLLWTAFVIADPSRGIPLAVAMLLTAQLVIGWVFGPRTASRVVVTIACWILVVAAVALPLWLGNAPVAWWGPQSAIAAALFGAFYSCWWFGWYIAVSVQWQAHGNEAGCIARVDRFAEFLRLKLTPDTVEVWAIGVTDNGDDDPPTIELIDHFALSRKVTNPG